MDRLENMDTFARVVETGSISAAANSLGVAKSAVSRRLKELEEHLGVQLFHRTTRRMNLTETGQSFYQHTLRILEDVLEAELAASQSHGQLRGTLKVALPQSFGNLHMGPAINEFLKTHPNIEFDLDFNDREVDLIKEGFDLAIRIANLPDSSLMARHLATMNTVVCASPGYLKQEGTPDDPSELINHKCMVYNLRRDFEHWQFINRNGDTINTRIRPFLKASTSEYLRDAAVADMGIILIPTFIAYKEIESGKLVPLFNEYRLPQIEAYAIYPQTRHLSQRVRVFIDFLVKRFAGIPYWDLCLQKK